MELKKRKKTTKGRKKNKKKIINGIKYQRFEKNDVRFYRRTKMEQDVQVFFKNRHKKIYTYEKKK